LNSQRHLFSLDRNVAYFNGAYMSPQLQTVELAGIEGLKRKGRPYEYGVDDFFEPVAQVKAAFAKLINVPAPERIAIIPSVSYGMAQIAHNLKVNAGDNIVLLEEQFPSNYYTWERMAEEKGLELRIVSAPVGHPRATSWNEQVLRQIDEHTALVTMAHIHWADGTRFDLEAISRKAKSVGALLAIDGTQSVGALPFDVQSIQPDALICAGYKWLLGPYSIGLAYYGPAFDGGRPIEENWINRAGSEDFKNLVNYQSAYRPMASRYSVGEQSNFIFLPMMQAALEQLLEWGPEAIQEYCRKLMTAPFSEMKSQGVMVEPEALRAHHLVGLRLPESINIDELRASFAAHQVHVSYRGNAIRLSCYLYNDQRDVSRLMNAFRHVC